MDGFADVAQARKIVNLMFQQPILSGQTVSVIYSYRFTDLDWSFTVNISPGQVRVIDGILPESETTIETTTSVFDRLMRGKMNPAAAHVSNEARVVGSFASAAKLRTLLPVLSKAYQAAVMQQNPSGADQTVKS